MIKWLKVDNFRSLVNFKINFTAMNILLGKNGSGKSTVFEVISNLKSFIKGDCTVDDVFEFDSLTRWQLVPIQTFSLCIESNSVDYVYSLEIEFNNELKKCRVKKESVTYDGNFIFKAENGKAFLFNDSYKQGPEVLVNWQISGVSAVFDRNDNKKLSNFKNLIEKIIVVHPDPNCIFDVFYPQNDDSCVTYSVDNISEVYFSTIQASPEKLPRLWNLLKEINPCFLRTYIKGDIGKSLCFEYEYNGAKTSYKISEISDGERMLFVLYFLVVMYLENGYSLLIDEPDNYISLEEILPLVQEIQDALENKGQCILISHHPNIIDYFAPSNGVLFERRSYGATEIVDSLDLDSGLTYSEILLHK